MTVTIILCLEVIEYSKKGKILLKKSAHMTSIPIQYK